MFAPSPLNELTEGSEASLADHLDQHPLAPPPVELAVEDPLPRAEVELAAGDGNHDLSAHHGAFEVRVGVLLAAVVPVPGDRLMRRQRLEPGLEVA